MKKYLFLTSMMLAVLTGHCQLSWSTVETVYNGLITAIGDKSKLPPPILTSRTQSKVAYFSPTKQAIYVEEKFLELCFQLGEDSTNALAFILGHELAHFYRNHGWVSASGLGYVGTDLKEDWKKLSKDEDNHAKDEAEADIFSGFYSLIAGYNALDVSAEVLTFVYRAYGLPDTIAGYPTLQQRIEIAEKSNIKSKELFTLFKVGMYCLATEKYEVASKIYTHIYNQDYAGAEILNNLAVSEILWGYTLLGESPRYYYPIFISTETPLDPNSRGNEAETRITRGISYLKIALEKSANNIQFMVNLASAYTMINQFTDAEYHLAKIEEKDAKNEDALLIRGVISAKRGDKKLAGKQWKSLAKTNELSQKNLAVLQGNLKMAANQTEASAVALPLVDAVELTDSDLKSKFDYQTIRIPGIRISYVELQNSMLIEVYGGPSIDYRFQSFNSLNYETIDYNWQVVLASASTSVYSSQFFNILKIKNRLAHHVAPTYVKYMWY